MFACLLLPHFRLQAALRWRETKDTNGAVAVVDDQTDILLEVNAAARVHGITPGQTGPQAMARDGRILLLAPSPAQEDCLGRLLVERALALSPHVEHTLPGAVTADLRRVRGNPCWQQAGDAQVERFRADGLRLHVGVAATPDLSVLAARGADPVAVVYEPAAFVHPLPLESLDPSASLRQVLADWGVGTVGDLLRLPRAGLVERLGAEVEGLLRRVSGRHRRPLRLVRQRPAYAEAFDFEYEVETAAPLLFLLRRFLNDLTARLGEAGRVARRMELAIPLDDGSCHERSFCIPAPTADADVLFRILDTHLETLQLDRRPVGVRLALDDVPPSRDQLRLFESALRDPNGFGETLARLKAFLGNDCVGVPVPGDTYEPDRFTLREGLGAAGEAAPSARLREDPPPGQGIPLRRFRPPPSASITLDDGRPARIASDPVTGAIIRSAGPYRLSGAWWDARRWEIEEWDVELADGGLFRLGRRQARWTVEGLYDA